MFYYTNTDIHGMLNIGTMFVFSNKNLEMLNLKKGNRMLDIGAGCG